METPPPESFFLSTPTLPTISGSTALGTPLVAGLKFFTKAGGQIESISFYRDRLEPCTGHTGKIFDSLGREVLSVAFVDEICTEPRQSEWVTQTFPIQATLGPGIVYTLTVGPLQTYSYTPDFFTRPYSNPTDETDFLGIPSDPTLTAKSSTNDQLPKINKKTMKHNMFLDVSFPPLNFFPGPPYKCDAIVPPSVEPSFTQSLFSNSEIVTELSVGTTIPPSVIGTRIKVLKDGFITGIRWFREKDEPGNPHTGLIYSTTTEQELGRVVFAASCTNGWIAQNLGASIRVFAGQEFTVAIGYVTRVPVASGYFATTKVSGDLSAGTRNGVTGRPGTFPGSLYGRNSNLWVDVVFADSPWDCSYYTPERAFCGSDPSGGTCLTCSAGQCNGPCNPV